MKRIKKWSALAIGLLTAVCMMVGCTDKGAGTPEDTFPYYPQRTQMKEDGQYYAPEGVEFPASLWQTPASERYEALDRGEIKAYFIQSVDDTKVFCYVGLPDGASAEDPVPAVVLVHGALGTAGTTAAMPPLPWIRRGVCRKPIRLPTTPYMKRASCRTVPPTRRLPTARNRSANSGFITRSRP